MKIYDISPEISPSLMVWPGDTPFEMKRNGLLKDGDTVNVSEVKMTLHIGAHVDADWHYSDDGVTMEKHSLETYIGRAQVITANVEDGHAVKPEDLVSEITEKRVLIKTGTNPDTKNWNLAFSAISVELAAHLESKDCILVGIDTPSVDLFGSTGLASHHRLYEAGIVNLEGIVLSEVPDGIYELIALPLKIADADASPVRAILRSL